MVIRKFPAEPLISRIEKIYPSIRNANRGQGNDREKYLEVSLADVAELAGLSRRHICRILNDYETLGENVVDAICCNVLRVHPWDVYGDLWIGGEDDG